jgi:hypothetical protein
MPAEGCMRAALLFALVLAGLGSALEAAPGPSAPNFVIVVVDDLRWDDLGIAGHPFVETPVIDRVAREGSRFMTGSAREKDLLPYVQAWVTRLQWETGDKLRH